MALAALRQWTAGGAPAAIRRGSIRSPRCRTAGSSRPTRRSGAAPARRWCSITLADAQAFNEILRVLGHARSDAFIRAGAERLVEILGPGTAIYHVNLLSFAFRLPGHAEPDPPAMIDRIVDGFREPILCDDVPIDTRIGIGLKALGRAGGSPGEDLRAALVGGAGQPRRAHAAGPGSTARATRRTAAPSACSPTSRHALDAEGQLELHYQPKVDARHRRLRQRRGAAALDPSAARPGLARRVRRARRDDGAGHADDPLGDRRGDPAGGDLGARGARPVARGQRLAEEPRGARLRRVPAVLLRGARGSTGRGSSSRSPRASAPRAAG